MKKGLNMFIKRMICAAVIIAMLPAADLVSFAESGQITDGNGITYEYDTGTQTAYVASNNDVSGDVTIPSAVTVNGVDCTVIGIDDDAFCNCDSLTSVYIPASVAFIGDDAFCNCYSLTSVYIPASVTFIGSNAFAECTDLKSITVPDDNTSFSSVDGILFSKDRSTLICFPAGKIVDSYTVPDSVTVIDWNAFYGARISSVTIPSSVNIIFGYAFSDCSVLEYVSIADGLEIIGNCSFRYTRLTSITIPSSVNSIGDSAFEGSTGLNTVFFDGSKEKWAGVSKGRNWSQTTKLGSDPAVKEVTFKVVNGSWDDGTKEDKVVTVIGNSAKSLSGYGIPSAGKKPADESFTTGAWNADPSTAELTGDTTFTYTYSVPKTKLTITVKDQTHIYSGYQQGEGDPINTDPAVIETKIDVEGLLSGDSLSGIVLDGSASDAGEYPDA